MKATSNSGICRISEAQRSWRVVVETWPERDGYHGRLVFTQDRVSASGEVREGPDKLRGHTREDVLREAYALPEERLREVFRSLA